MSSGLTYEERSFVNEYMNTLHIGKASKAINVSLSTGYRIFKRLHVQEYLEEQWLMRQSRNHLDADKLIREIARISQSDITDYFENLNGNMLTLKDFETLTPEQTRCIEVVEETISPTGEVKIKLKLYNKTKAMELAAKNLGLIVDRLRITTGQDPELGPVQHQHLVKILGSPEKIPSLEEWEKQHELADKYRAEHGLIPETTLTKSDNSENARLQKTEEIAK